MGKQAVEVKNIREMSKYVEELTNKRTNMYRAVISLTEENAMRMGFDDEEQWQELVKRKMPEIAEKLGIPVSKLEYTAAVHMEKGHPHCHVLFWEKNQGVKKPFIHNSIANQIRIDLIKHVFGEEMSDLQKIKNEARKASTENMGNFFDNFLDPIENMTPKEYKETLETIRKESDLADSKLPFGKYSAEDTYTLATELLKIREHIPKTGRLQMKFMPPEVKKEIHDFLLKLMERNVDCDREFKLYVSSAKQLATYYTNNPDIIAKAETDAYEDMLNRLSNVVLKKIKEINKMEREVNKETRGETFRRQMFESLVKEIFGVLTRSSNAENNKVQHAHRYGELSKQAKKELALKYESDTGYDWER